ncbi:hypothetical protein JAAARDRAFT_197239 [Jaapia argillacea MUCL 33604]|uniref:Uncharacterized protein n=1 Tax=Jaapia argillacea MUCL 33604 TaxID=933084 RepID=A0A067PFW3_9AGAM|nr:hypothetical protein JAAARDRAFT_197239 [Jaapia argillacea MUCL 33604]
MRTCALTKGAGFTCIFDSAPHHPISPLLASNLLAFIQIDACSLLGFREGSKGVTGQVHGPGPLYQHTTSSPLPLFNPPHCEAAPSPIMPFETPEATHKLPLPTTPPPSLRIKSGCLHGGLASFFSILYHSWDLKQHRQSASRVSPTPASDFDHTLPFPNDMTAPASQAVVYHHPRSEDCLSTSSATSPPPPSNTPAPPVAAPIPAYPFPAHELAGRYIHLTPLPLFMAITNAPAANGLLGELKDESATSSSTAPPPPPSATPGPQSAAPLPAYPFAGFVLIHRSPPPPSLSPMTVAISIIAIGSVSFVWILDFTPSHPIPPLFASSVFTLVQNEIRSS